MGGIRRRIPVVTGGDQASDINPLVRAAEDTSVARPALHSESQV